MNALITEQSTCEYLRLLVQLQQKRAETNKQNSNGWHPPRKESFSVSLWTRGSGHQSTNRSIKIQLWCSMTSSSFSIFFSFFVSMKNVVMMLFQSSLQMFDWNTNIKLVADCSTPDDSQFNSISTNSSTVTQIMNCWLWGGGGGGGDGGNVPVKSPVQSPKVKLEHKHQTRR